MTHGVREFSSQETTHQLYGFTWVLAGWGGVVNS